MKWKIWYTLPNGKAFNFTSRSCTSSIGLMALKQFHPDRMPDHPLIDGAAHRLHDSMVGEMLPDGCAVMVRHPVDRFRSLLGKLNITAETAFCWLYWFHGVGEKPETTDRLALEYTAGTSWHHLTPVSEFVTANSKLFKFPDIEGMASYLGITEPVEHINACPADPKPELTAEQEAKVLSIYASDLAIWESLD